MNQITFVIPSLPPSVNSIYEIVYRLREVRLTPKARHWKSDSKQYVRRFVIAPDSLLQIDFVFHYPFHHANGNMREFDSPNLLKLAIDCIAEKLEIRDKRVKSGSWHSVDSEKEFVEVTLREVTNGKLHQTEINNQTQKGD